MKKLHALRPRDAATLIIVRNRSEVLLGVRSAKHVFMPHIYVFPGGKVDGGDARVASPVSLRTEVEAKLTRSVSAARARALAMTAVRETFEETGLIIGRETSRPPQTRSAGWQPFFARGYVPALDKLDYVARAITPPGSVRRFDARFFLVDANEVSGELQGSGELEDLAWVPLNTASSLPLSEITEMMLGRLKHRLSGESGSSQQIPFYRQRFGREVLETE